MRTTLLLAMALASSALADPPPPSTGPAAARLEGGRVLLERPGQPPRPVEVGCVPLSAVVGQQLHVACADGRVLSFDLQGEPRLAGVARFEGEVRAVFLVGSQPWVELVRVEARPLPQVALAPPPPPSTPPLPGAEAAPAAAPPPPAAAPAPRVADDDSLLGPKRQGNLVVLGAGLRLLVPIGTLGVGASLEASATWHAEVPFALQVRVWPLAGVVTSTGTAGAYAGSVDALFDGRYFAAGLGIGLGQVTSYGGPLYPSGSSAGFVITQDLRVGALDGIQFTGQTQIIAGPGGFGFYGGEGMFQVPLQRKWLLQFKGGGLASGFAFGEVAMRIGLGAEGERSTIFLAPSAGFTLVRYAAGPSVGLAFEYRLPL